MDEVRPVGEHTVSGTFRYEVPPAALATARFSMVVKLEEGWADGDVSRCLERAYSPFAIEGTFQWTVTTSADRELFHPECRWRDGEMPMVCACTCPECREQLKTMGRSPSREKEIEMWTLRYEELRRRQQWLS